MKYTNPQVAQFVQDMDNAGIDVTHYRGRFFWEGPAVFTDEQDGPTRDDVVGATTVPLQYDNLAFDWIVYPKASDKGEEEV